MSDYFFNTIVERTEDNLEKVEVLRKMVKTPSKTELFRYGKKLIEPVEEELQNHVMKLFYKYLIYHDSVEYYMFGGAESFEKMKHYSQKQESILENVSATLDVPAHIIEHAVSWLDIAYLVDKDFASAYVDRLTRERWSAWIDNLPKENKKRDLLDLIVLNVIRIRGRKLSLKGLVRRIIGTVFLKITGQYNE